MSGSEHSYGFCPKCGKKSIVWGENGYCTYCSAYFVKQEG